MAALDSWHLCQFLLDTGARYDEIAKLEWNVVDLENGTINLYRGKVDNESTLRLRGLATLTDPVLLPFDGDGLLIAGTELQSTEGGRKIWEYRQVWLCHPAAGTEADWARNTFKRTHATHD